VKPHLILNIQKKITMKKDQIYMNNDKLLIVEHVITGKKGILCFFLSDGTSKNIILPRTKELKDFIYIGEL
jgi:hypothetical protein